MLTGANLLFLAGIAVAQAQTPAPRTEIPIQQVTLSDGAIRYSIPIQIGGATVTALLDTGSTGLRVLPDVISPDEAEGPDDKISFGSHTSYTGRMSKASLQVGTLSAPLPFELIEEICGNGGCQHTGRGTRGQKHKLGAEGLPDEGFDALIGIKTGPSDIANPLLIIGAKRWIVELPRPGDAAPGKLVLNPSDREVTGYAYVPLLAQFRQSESLHDALSGCLKNLANGAEACGSVTFDTGYPAMNIIDGPIGLRLGQRTWPADTKAELTLFDGKEPRAAAAFHAGPKGSLFQVFLTAHGWRSGIVILAGVAPYLAFDILYDPARNAIGLKPREAAPGIPSGQVIPLK